MLLIKKVEKMNTKYNSAKWIFDIGYYFHRISAKTNFLGNDMMKINVGFKIPLTKKASFKSRLVYFYEFWKDFYGEINKITLSKNLNNNVKLLNELLKETISQKKRFFTEDIRNEIIDEVKKFISLINSELNNFL